MTFRATLILTCLLASFGFGWYSRIIYDGYRADKAANDRVEAIGKATTDIVKANQKIVKAEANDKDDCIPKRVPANIQRLLK